MLDGKFSVKPDQSKKCVYLTLAEPLVLDCGEETYLYPGQNKEDWAIDPMVVKIKIF